MSWRHMLLMFPGLQRQGPTAGGGGLNLARASTLSGSMVRLLRGALSRRIEHLRSSTSTACVFALGEGAFSTPSLDEILRLASGSFFSLGAHYLFFVRFFLQRRATSTFDASWRRRNKKLLKASQNYAKQFSSLR